MNEIQSVIDAYYGDRYYFLKTRKIWASLIFCELIASENGLW